MKKKILVLCCVTALVLGTVGGWLIWQHTAFDDKPFGYRYSISSVFFFTGQMPVYAVENEMYALTNTGKLMDISGEQAERLTGSMRKITLDQENFDNCFHPDGTWRVIGLDAESARADNLQTWKYKNGDGSFYYIMLQKNGDVFLCLGKDGKIDQFVWLQPLYTY